jgi:osmoprotectant transport system permease protein
VPLGFANSYALAMVAAQASKLGISRLSDLARHPELRLGLSQEFLSRKDGWEALKGGIPHAVLAARPGPRSAVRSPDGRDSST